MKSSWEPNMERIVKYIAGKIEEKIKASGKTATEIAKACGKTPGWLSNIIRQDSEIGIVDLITISKYLDVDITEFLPVPQKINIEKMSMLEFIQHKYSPTEITRILEAAEKVEREAWPHTMLQKYVKRIILLLLYTGMRPGEVINLRWENIKVDKIVLKRTETKQRREKVIPLTGGIKAVLDSLRADESGEYVIPRRRDQRITSSQSTKTALAKMRKVSGIKDFDFHSLRHTASTIMVSQALGKGVGLADIMEILGHSKIETTMKYLHSDFGRMKKAMKILEKSTVSVKARNPEKP